MKRAILILLCGLLLGLATACEDEAEEVAPTPEPTRPPYVLRDDAMPPVSGPWRLVADSVNFEERETGLILSARYEHATNASRGDVLLTVYRDPADAQSDFEQRVAAWQDDPANTVEEIRTLANGAYLLNDGAEGIALVFTDSTVLINANPAEVSRLEALNLAQIGVDVLRVRVPLRDGPRGTLGRATPVPPESP
ncbi:MAG: hypothetical protein ACLFTK_03875 [Anaerolineales bacterium]